MHAVAIGIPLLGVILICVMCNHNYADSQQKIWEGCEVQRKKWSKTLIGTNHHYVYTYTISMGTIEARQ